MTFTSFLAELRINFHHLVEITGQEFENIAQSIHHG